MAEDLDPTNHDIPFPHQLRGMPPAMLQNILQSQFIHSVHCKQCNEPVCVFIKKHWTHHRGCGRRRTSSPCAPCGRLTEWLQVHCVACSGPCPLQDCAPMKDHMRSRRLQQISQLFPYALMDSVLSEVQEMSADDYAHRKQIIQSFFLEVKSLMRMQDSRAYIENRDWTRVARLGSGGYGQCHKVQDVYCRLSMALKEDNPNRHGLNEEEAFFGMIVRQQMSVVPHNLVEYFHVQPNPLTHLNQMQMFMELMNCTLSDHLAQSGPLSNYNIRFYCFQIFEGISFLHNRHYIHRDIKPDNLLLNDTRQRLKIADFGFAVFCRNETLSNPPKTIPGTRSYNPPEAYSERLSGKFTDVWQSAASTLFMCTVRRPVRHVYADKEPTPDTFRKLAAMPHHPIPGWLAPDIHSLLKQCLVGNFRARISADEAKVLVRDTPIDSSTTSEPSGQGKRIDLYYSPFESRCQRIYFCAHRHPGEHDPNVCTCLLSGWTTCFEDVSPDETLRSLVQRPDVLENQHTVATVEGRMQHNYFQCFGTNVPCEELTLNVLTRQISLKDSDHFHRVNLDDQVSMYRSLIIADIVQQT